MVGSIDGTAAAIATKLINGSPLASRTYTWTQKNTAAGGYDDTTGGVTPSDVAHTIVGTIALKGKSKYRPDGTIHTQGTYILLAYETCQALAGSPEPREGDTFDLEGKVFTVDSVDHLPEGDGAKYLYKVFLVR